MAETANDTGSARQAQEPSAATRSGEFGWRIFVDAAVPPAAAIVCFAAGVLLLFSAAQPNLADRMGDLLTVLPLSLVEVSHFAASLLGMLLLFLAVGLWRRIDTAWWAAIAVLLSGAAFSVLKALHWEEAALLCLVAAALFPFRSSFYRRGHISDGLLSLPGFILIFAVTGLAIWLLLAAYEKVPYQEDLWWTFLRDSDAPRSMRALAGAVMLGLVVAVWQLSAVRQNRRAGQARAEDIARAEAIFASAPDGHPDANLMFVGDKSFVFTPSGKSVVMYGQRGGLWIAMGNPVGPADEQTEALIAFHEAADHAGKSPVIYAAAGDLLPSLVDLGYAIRKIGETACIDVQAFSLEGPSRSRLRQARSRAHRDGWRVEVIPAGGDAPWAALKQISDAWLRSHSGGEKAFSLGRYDAAYLARFPLALVRHESTGQPVAFASLWPAPGGKEMAVDLMRHGPDAPGGVMDFLFIEVTLWAKDQGVHIFDLGMAPLSGLRAGRYSPALNNVGQMAYDRGESLYGFRGLRAYKSKFAPEWKPLFIAAPPRVSLPVALMSVALLTSGGILGLIVPKNTQK
ncbi:phosphatidylglycerol lysyltransferase domain-containing protein [Hyphomonas sp. WL0036]|uniref:phosphatidylglycerol lysyltransferase domain-containing protein n=1 Tax=Hyphomonas sediminis TaxID=2866160 RepID=UPI001C7FC1E2|nr:phosphatidylglycerol lysyltransferase domain-containing protein [Hyphomonas sediminis]MBY9068406.1 phosphatidylglycerol lysyltransferase domain-containing protein [Hyphomonas sediminis]